VSAHADRKFDEYYAERRTSLTSQLPRPLGRVLDVGCGAGAVGRELRELGGERLVGIEIDPDAAARAEPVYDAVHVGSVDAVLGELDGPFDTIVCYDVLEHLVDPWAVLARLHALAADGAHLQVSVPNARHPAFALGILARGTVGYEAAGLRDITHLRWFTRRDIGDAVSGAGWTVLAHGHNPVEGLRRRVIDASGGRLAEFLVGQLYVLATKRSAG